MRTALYARVSTRDKGQDVENQLAQLREFCARQGWTVAREFVDHASAAGALTTALVRGLKGKEKEQRHVR